MGWKLDWNCKRYCSCRVWSNLHIYGCWCWCPRVWDSLHCCRSLNFSWYWMLTFPSALIILYWKHLRWVASSFCPSKVWPPWWVGSLSQHWPWAFYWCSCLVVWEVVHLSSPPLYGIGLLDYSWWVPLMLIPISLILTVISTSYICWHQACV